MGECLGPGRGELRQRAGVPGLPERSALLLSPCLLPALQLLVWHCVLWTVHEATPLGPARSLPQSFLLKCLEQVRKIQADGAELQERLVSEGGQRGDGEVTEMLQQGREERRHTGRAEGESGAEGKRGKEQQEGTRGERRPWGEMRIRRGPARLGRVAAEELGEEPLGDSAGKGWLGAWMEEEG